MKRNVLLLLVLLLANYLRAGDIIGKDTTNSIKIKEIVVTASPKESKHFRQLPVTVSTISQHEMQAYQVNSLKSMNGIVPNLFIPDYGSRLTSAIYIRGIGSRINTPSVGLYVDDIPYIDKSAFDFNFSDIESIEVLRGPQSTLYGRNAMGGLIKLHTKSPFSYQGTDLKLSAGTYDSYSASLTHYHRVSDKFAFSAGGFYDKSGGFFNNVYLNKKADPFSDGGGRIRSIWLPKDNLKLDLNVSYEYSDQGGYPYAKYDKTTGKTGDVSTNLESTYYRGLLNAGLNISYQTRKYTMSAMTSFQNLKDRMFMDQDFTAANMYSITQKQKQNTVTEEIVFKSTANKRYEYVCGAFGFYQSQNTNSPVNFGSDFLVASRMPSYIKSIAVPGEYDTPTMGAALFHQSTFNNILFKGLSASIGVRLDYEKTKISYNTNATINSQPMQTTILTGDAKDDYLQLLPKLALKYDFNDNKLGNVYASVSEGYRSGGYNYQMFADLVQGLMMASPASGYTSSNVNVKNAIIYKPEYTWSYEAGTHLSLLDNKLTADLAAFYMDTRDQQIVKFAPSGLGRMTVNSGHSASLGAEASVRAIITNALSLNASYGYTHAIFKDYIGQVKNQQQQIVSVDYKDNYVPMIPQNTFSLGGEYAFTFQNCFINKLVFNAQYNGVGKIYWTESNDLTQKSYGLLNGKIGITMNKVQVDFWGRNLTDKSYATFGFVSSSNTLMQKGRPMQAGVDLRYRF